MNRKTWEILNQKISKIKFRMHCFYLCINHLAPWQILTPLARTKKTTILVSDILCNVIEKLCNITLSYTIFQNTTQTHLYTHKHTQLFFRKSYTWSTDMKENCLWDVGHLIEMLLYYTSIHSYTFTQKFAFTHTQHKHSHIHYTRKYTTH